MNNSESMGEKELLTKAIGGWRGLVDSALPSMLFILIFVFQKNKKYLEAVHFLLYCFFFVKTIKILIVSLRSV